MLAAQTDYLLEQWGLWQRIQPQGAIKPHVLGIVVRSGQRCSINDDAACAVDRCVARLKQRDLQLYTLLQMRYIYCMSVNQMAQQLKDNRIAVERRLAGAVGWIDCALHAHL